MCPSRTIRVKFSRPNKKGEEIRRQGTICKNLNHDSFNDRSKLVKKHFDTICLIFLHGVSCDSADGFRIKRLTFVFIFPRTTLKSHTFNFCLQGNMSICIIVSISSWLSQNERIIWSSFVNSQLSS